MAPEKPSRRGADRNISASQGNPTKTLNENLRPLQGETISITIGEGNKSFSRTLYSCTAMALAQQCPQLNTDQVEGMTNAVIGSLYAAYRNGSSTFNPDIVKLKDHIVLHFDAKQPRVTFKLDRKLENDPQSHNYMLELNPKSSLRTETITSLQNFRRELRLGITSQLDAARYGNIEYRKGQYEIDSKGRALARSAFIKLDAYLEEKSSFDRRLVSTEELLAALSSEERTFVSRLLELPPQKLGVTSPPVDEPPLSPTAAYAVPGFDEIPMTKEAGEAFADLANACKAATGEDLLLTSGYRSPGYQTFIFLNKLLRNKFDLEKTLKHVAFPGYSQHSSVTALALDVRTKDAAYKAFEKTAAYRWLTVHAKDYGFSLSSPQAGYQYSFESWHWRFEGRPSRPVNARIISKERTAPTSSISHSPEKSLEASPKPTAETPNPAPPPVTFQESPEIVKTKFWKKAIQTHLESSNSLRLAQFYSGKSISQLSEQWSDAILDAIKYNHIPLTAQNVAICLTQVDREGEFLEDPRIPNPSSMYSRYRGKAIREIESFLSPLGIAAAPARPLVNSLIQKYDKRYKKKFLACRTEGDLDKLYTEIQGDLNKDPLMGKLLALPIVGTKIRERLDSFNPVRTVGAMQIRLETAQVIAKKRGLHLSNSQMKHQLYNFRENLKYGFALLGEGIDAYLLDGKGSVEHVFSDYNSGFCSSRNAGFQHGLNLLDPTTKRVIKDGDLLIYSEGAPVETSSKTEQKIQIIVQKYGLPLTPEKIRQDLLLEKNPEFEKTDTYRLISQKYTEVKNDAIPYCKIPQIEIEGSEEKFGEKISTLNYVRGSMIRYEGLYAKLSNSENQLLAQRSPL